ncbi:MAG: acylphosphatase [Nitrososphaerota archaeon]|nr:acylphosphatase [Aigarchaeota archaeon]MDW8076114.1 acylphosphatase [Nitrososphaerota archaeon]
MKVRAHVYVSGVVQGVFFRSNTKRMADRLGVKGWVRNLPDGRVEAVFEGEREAVVSMIEWCHRGPPDAIVENVEVKWEEYKGEFKDFRIIY